MERFLDLLDRAIAAVENAMTLMACLAIAAMVLITAVDVIFRYALNAPFSWSHDLITQYLLVALFFLALSYVARTAGHMSLDFAVRNVTSPWIRNGFAAIGDLLGLLLAVGIAWGGWGTAMTALEQNEVLPGALPLPTWPARFLVPLGAGVLALRLFCRMLQAIDAARRGQVAAPAATGR
jgi:TRAP-type C4-dicarboxylate transport system permease small subunit